MRERFFQATADVLDRNPRTALVLAEISAGSFRPVAARHPDRVFNLGIREQLMIGVAGGLALAGLRPIAHSYATFTVDRVYEQLKLDLDHQGVGAVVVSVGASYDGSESGYTHFSPGDVALLDTLTGWTVEMPGHPDEVARLLRAAVGREDRTYLRLSTQRNSAAHAGDGRLQPVRRGTGHAPVVVAVGPMLDPVLDATAGLDVTVAYTNTPRPFDAAGLRALVGSTALRQVRRLRSRPADWLRPRTRRPSPPPGEPARVVLVEPYLAGTSSRVVAEALAQVPHRLLALGVGRVDLRRYGSPADHAGWHGLDPVGIRRSLIAWL